MTKMTHNLGLKVFAVFLAVICGAVGLLSTSALIFAGDQGFYTGAPPSFYESDWCKRITREYAQTIAGDYQRTISEGNSFAPSGNSNFGYRLYDQNGKELAQANIPDGVGFEGDFSLDFVTGENMTDVETYQVHMYVAEPIEAADDYFMPARIYDGIFRGRYAVMIVSVASLVLFLGFFVYLLCAAGHRGKTDEITPNFQDRIPLEIYFCIVWFLALPCLAFFEIFRNITVVDVMLCAVILLYFMALFIAVSMSMATRLKKGKWWRNSIIYWCFHVGWKFFLGIITTCSDAITALPMTWKVVVGWLFISAFYLSSAYNPGTIFVINTLILFLLISIAAQLQKLRKAGEQLANGNLDFRVDTKGMFRTFGRHGSNLNSLSKGASIAMEQKMKSERLKTELITNVSHDIKTPLTSIINYVDLLKKEELTERGQEYLEVLDRQSRRLKKLTEDLVETSKASTGNISVRLAPVDICELVNQAVAEYGEKMENANLEVIVDAPEEPIFGMVDGNLAWRVLSNLLSNAYKYSQTGTRVYIDLCQKEEMVLISMKNISRDPLNVDADDLMERFVRGDSSRTTEGSGLGLNIARSLVELQKGTFQLFIDGDLFKATVGCPFVREVAMAPKQETEKEVSPFQNNAEETGVAENEMKNG